MLTDPELKNKLPIVPPIDIINQGSALSSFDASPKPTSREQHSLAIISCQLFVALFVLLLFSKP